VLVGLTFGWIDRSWTFGFLPGFIAIGVAMAVILIATWMTPEGETTDGYFLSPTRARGSEAPVHA
jgi:hypothetical protein